MQFKAAPESSLDAALRRRDVRFAWVWGAAMVALTTLPTALAVAAPPPALTGFGTVMFVNDFGQYEAAMNEGARSASWLVHDHFTPEPHPAALMFPLYVLIGKLGAALGTGWEPVYRVAEVASRGVLATTLAAFALRFAHPRHRRLGVALTIAGAGIGFWAMVAQAAVGVSEPYAGNASYELNTYELFFGTPHAALGLAASLGAIWLLLAPSPRHIRLASCVVAIGLLHPFNLATLVLVAGVLLGAAVVTASDWRGPLLAAVVVGLAAAPFVIYNALTFASDPFWSRTYGAQNLLPSPAPWELIVDLGVQALGLVGIVVGWRRGGVCRNLALVAGTLFIAMYAPVPFQRRLGFGVFPLLAVLATVALGWWEQREQGTGNREQDVAENPLSPVRGGEGEGEGEPPSVTFEPPVAAPRFMSNSVVSRLSTVAPLLLLVAALTTPLFIYAGMLLSVRTNAPIAVYRATPELQAARDWLAANSGPADLILGSWDVMNYVAAAIPGATVGGHPVATAEMARRRSVASSIFLDASRQEQAIRSEGATYLVSAGPHEPVFSSEARMVYRMGDVQVVALLAAGR